VLLQFLPHGLAGLEEETALALMGTASMPPMPLFLLSAGGAATAILGASLELGERFGGSAWAVAVAQTGQMALTWYLGHLLLGVGGLMWLGLNGGQPIWVAVVSACGFFAVIIALSVWWKRAHRQGPLEWLMRRLCDGNPHA